MPNLSQFCNSTFWDFNLTWNSDYPRFTPCFEKTVLIWIPCGLLWIFSAFDIYSTLRGRSREIPWNWRNITKFMVLVLLVLTCFFDLTYYSFINERTYLVDICSSFIRLLSLTMLCMSTKFGENWFSCLAGMLTDRQQDNSIRFPGYDNNQRNPKKGKDWKLWNALCTYLVIIHRKCGKCSSGFLFMFWLLIVLLGIPQFSTEVENLITESKYFSQITYFVWYSSSLVMLLLNCISDLPPQYIHYSNPENVFPEATAPFPSRLTFSWVGSLIKTGFKRPLVNSDLWNLKYTQTTNYMFNSFSKYWTPSDTNFTQHEDDTTPFIKSTNTKSRTKSVLIPLCKAFGPKFCFGALVKLGNDLLRFSAPLLLKYLIAFIQNDEPQWRGYLYATLLFFGASIETLMLGQYYHIMTPLGQHVKMTLTSVIYRKALKITNAARKESSSGEIVNLVSVDAERFRDLTIELNMLWSAPLQITIAILLLWQTLGISVLAGVATMVLMIPINGFIVKKQSDLYVKQMKKKDDRIKIMTEILSGIKVLKMYAWESSFERNIMDLRDKEIKILRYSGYLNAITAFIWICTPLVVTIVTFTTFVLIDSNNILDSQKAFVSLSLFNILGYPLSMFPLMISEIVQARISVERINKFLNNDELDPTSVTHDELEDNSLSMRNCTISWGLDNDPTLHGINLNVRKGSLVAVVGTVGSGKSSLIAALLGEMDKIDGDINVVGSVAYVPQLAWIQNATLQENILFGKSLDNRSYRKVIDACALRQDLEMLPAQDKTEIGEKGINLSGGQKQRVSLARAVYSDCDVYLLDDPLSAVDSHVGRHIFENVLSSKGILSSKTRLLVTHNIAYLPEVDKIIVLNDGCITAKGTYKELLEQKGSFSEFILTQLEEGVNEKELEEIDDNIKEELLKANPGLLRQFSRQKSTDSSLDSSCTLRRRSRSSSVSREELDHEIVGERLIEEERAEIGQVKRGVYLYYMKSIGVFITLIVITFNIVSQGFSAGSNMWLSYWSSSTGQKVTGGSLPQDFHNQNTYLEIYALLGLGRCISTIIGDIIGRIGFCIAAVRLHNALLTRILHTPLSFTDTTPIGRILSRFSRDVDTVDIMLPFLLSDGLFAVLEIVGSIFVISYSTPIFIAIIIPIGVVYYFIQKYFIASSRQIKRLESISNSPIYSHFEESISGTSSIRAYRAHDRFIREVELKMDINHQCSYSRMLSNRWLSIRLETIGNIIVFFTALFAVTEKHKLNPGIVGLSIVYALEITQSLTWLVRTTSSIENEIVSVERIKEYSELPQEAPWEIASKPVRKDWPDEGVIEFIDFKLRYREGLELVLKGINATIKSGEKVGIVGRTGAGKSSLTLGLFRIVEAAGGKVLIDGVDISEIGLHTLRSHLTIIPQDPVLFSGSLRVNLDPFKKYSDTEIWAALEHAHLISFVKAQTGELEYDVTEGGENLSVGQRQLVCLARALLRKTKILILDEATAAIDMETDDFIQKTIRTQFSDCTVLTIAHRLNTILDSDRVVVLDKGEIVEFESPSILLKNKSSTFYSMAHDAGIV